jgi:hypothetical protein
MKYFIYLILVTCSLNLAHGQTKIEKLVPVKQGQQINFDFTWPELITFKTWAGSEIKIVAAVEINKGQNDEAFKFNVDETSSEINITSFIENYKNLPKRIVIHKGGQEYFFNTDDTNSPEVRKFKEENGDGGYDYINYGVIMDIVVEVWVPNNISIDVYSKFGMIEVFGFTGDMKIHSRFGGIDLSTSGKEAIKVGTKFGEKFTNLTEPIKSISAGTHPGNWDWVMLGDTKSSKEHELKSDFGNIYIRKM